MSSVQRTDWRNILEKVVEGVGIIAAFTLAGLWIYFIWDLDWVHTFGSSRTPRRNWNIGLALLVLGGPSVFILVLLFFEQMLKSFRPKR